MGKLSKWKLQLSKLHNHVQEEASGSLWGQEMLAHIGNLAKKDATEKSDAKEAFLAELALDSKKGAKQINKRKNKEYRKMKDIKATSTYDSGSVDEDGVDMNKHEDEAMRRKMELEA
ncbi:unnamed protein product [Lactuca saligna]|uniref:Uncharacterized protein n=1 Tax=Lactuca saligna TaxID=75948 RepID=A0AA35VM75_LACSI|nr:unnamed protein product [Lactuca saligna]